MSAPNCHGLIGCAYHWQELSSGVLGFLAGLLGFGAAIWAVATTLQSERRRDQRELVSLKRALTTEITQFAQVAFEAHNTLKTKTAGQGASLHELEDAIRFPAAVVYPNSASRLGLLGDDAHNVVVFFQRIDGLCTSVVRIRHTVEEQLAAMAGLEARVGSPFSATVQPSTRPIGGEQTGRMAEALLKVLEDVAKWLPRLTAGSVDEAGAVEFREAVQKAREWWGGDRFRS